MIFCEFLKKIGGRIPNLNMLIILVNLSRSTRYFYTKDVSALITDYRDIFGVWCKFQVCHAPLCSIFEKKLWGFNPEHVDHFRELI